ncbi:hypothetical protein D3C76_1358750 [compost metagenome]
MLAVEAADAAEPRQRYLPYPLAVIVELLDPGGGVPHVLRKQVAGAAVHPQHLRALGDEVTPVGRAGLAGIHRHQPAVGCPPVGQQVERAAPVIHQVHIRLQIPLHRQQRGAVLGQILHIEPVA